MPNPFSYIQKVLFQTIQFSISTQFNSIWSKDRTLSDVTTPDQSGPGSYGNKRISASPKALALLEPHHQIVKYPIQDTHWGVLLHCGEAVGVFYSPNRLGKGIGDQS